MSDRLCDIRTCARDGIECSVPGRLEIRLCARHALDLGFCPLCGRHLGSREVSKRFAGTCKECDGVVRSIVDGQAHA